MRNLTLAVPCHFGLEAVVKREIYDLGYDVTRVEDGRVTFAGDEEAVCRANICLRSAQRVLLVVGRFLAQTFDELFEGIRALPWEEYLPADARFWVTKASCVKSRLFSSSDIQSVAKKAMVERMKEKYPLSRFPETGADYPVRIFLYKDDVTVSLDTSGESLHKRGYRLLANRAPLTETLAASLLMLTPWKADRVLVDPFCGSGTFPIEAAMTAAHIAPGVRRSFTAELWHELIPKKMWADVREEAREEEDRSVKTDIEGYDIDPDAVRIARENAKRAGVDRLIHFQVRPVSELSNAKKYGFIVTNPPYGERMGEKEELSVLYRQIGDAYRRLDNWSMYLISAYEQAESAIGRKADRNRKIYNGMIEARFYSFLGGRPPKTQKSP